MRINWHPQYGAAPYQASLQSESRIKVNGELLNFNALGEGDQINRALIPNDKIAGSVVEKVDGEIHLTLILPYQVWTGKEPVAPLPTIVTEPGEIVFPRLDPVNTEGAADVDA